MEEDKKLRSLDRTAGGEEMIEEEILEEVEGETKRRVKNCADFIWTKGSEVSKSLKEGEEEEGSEQGSTR